jgi:hypothetical protein
MPCKEPEMKYTTLYTAKYSGGPSKGDDVTIPAGMAPDKSELFRRQWPKPQRLALAKHLREAGILHSGVTLIEVRTEGDAILVFPRNGYEPRLHHSIHVIRLEPAAGSARGNPARGIVRRNPAGKATKTLPNSWYSPSGRTYLAPEAHAYPNGGQTRKGKAICEDGEVRTVYAGIPDTYFSIPAHATVDGKYTAGFLTNDDGEWHFTANKFKRTRKNPVLSTPVKAAIGVGILAAVGGAAWYLTRDLKES